MKKYEAIILLGGKGTRVKKYTKNKPKCLIDICGKPFLYHQLKYLKKNKIDNVILSSGYKSYIVENYVKKNINFINVKIINDGKYLLGTGGAINKSIQYLKSYFYVIYGDSYLNFKLQNLKIKKKLSVMAIFKNENKYDKSNVEKKINSIIYDKNSNNNNYKYIDYGVSVLDKKIFNGMKKNIRFDLSILLEKISKKSLLKGYIVKKRFYEIGSYNGIQEFKKYIKNEFYKKL